MDKYIDGILGILVIIIVALYAGNWLAEAGAKKEGRGDAVLQYLEDIRNYQDVIVNQNEQIINLLNN